MEQFISMGSKRKRFISLCRGFKGKGVKLGTKTFSYDEVLGGNGRV